MLLAELLVTPSSRLVTMFAGLTAVAFALVLGAAGCRTASRPDTSDERVGAEKRRAAHLQLRGGAGGSGSVPAPSTDPGALLDVSMTSKVGILLDEVPAGMRDRV